MDRQNAANSDERALLGDTDAGQFALGRYVDAQAGRFDTALAEIGRGAKRGHWIWYVFPQIAGLSHSEMAQHYAIQSLEEARAYLAHPLLGARLRQSVGAVQDLPVTTAEAVFGPIDAMKVRSSLTLFEVAGGGVLFAAALDRWFGSRDTLTLAALARNANIAA